LGLVGTWWLLAETANKPIIMAKKLCAGVNILH
jgi:hypothetical protein